MLDAYIFFLALYFLVKRDLVAGCRCLHYLLRRIPEDNGPSTSRAANSLAIETP